MSAPQLSASAAKTSSTLTVAQPPTPLLPSAHAHAPPRAQAGLHPIHAPPLSASLRVHDPAAAAAAACAAAPHGTPGLLSGKWAKDWAASDSMDATADAMALPWPLRQALRFVSELKARSGPCSDKGVSPPRDSGHTQLSRPAAEPPPGCQIQQSATEFQTTLRASVINISEAHLLSGEARNHPRRDLRSGPSAGRVELMVPNEGGQPGLVRVRSEWGAPHAGRAEEVFALAQGGSLLYVDTRLDMAEGRQVAYRTVYRRS